MSRIVKSISFNLNDPIEDKLYHHSQQYPNFSKLIKHLIQNHMYETKTHKTELSHQILSNEPAQKTPANHLFNPDLMKNLL